MTDRRKGTWVIDVCRTCGRHATWPFCAHREQPPPPGCHSWVQSVTVHGTWTAAYPRPESEGDLPTPGVEREKSS